MQDRLHSAMRWIAGAAAAGIIGAVAVLFGRDLYCALRPLVGLVECAVTDDDLAKIANEERKTAAEELRRIAPKAKQANDNLETAKTRLLEAKKVREAAAEKLRAAEDTLKDAERSFVFRRKCDPAEPTGGEQLERSLAKARADVGDAGRRHSEAARLVKCLGWRIDEADRQRDRGSPRDPDPWDLARGQTPAVDDCIIAYIIDNEVDFSTDVASLYERKRDAVADQARAFAALQTALARVEERESELSSHLLAVAAAQQCARARAQATEAEARAARDEARAAVGDRSEDLTAAEGRVTDADQAWARAKELVHGLAREKEQACRDLTEATATLTHLGRPATADKGEKVAREHGCS